ncbi:MAG: TonB-dependent receptor [Salinivirgaceae bacterium]|nr:TonB-dependent receptor [Salinivirgaceae bacterium]
MKKILIAILALTLATTVSAQEQQLTRDQILSMSFEELSDLPFDQLMAAAETLGVSSVDELFAMIMNKNVSSASKKEESAFTSPLSSTVITRDELRSYGVSTIEEALRFVPGVIVSEKYNGIYDVQLRGLNNIPDNHWCLYTENSNTILMVDGRPLQNQGMGSTNMDMIPVSIEDIAQIEVVRGAVSALYGMGAVTGVINIVTEKPSVDSKIVSGQFKMGNYNTMNGEVAVRKAINNKLSVGLSVNMQRRDRVTNKIHLYPQDDYSGNDYYIQPEGSAYYNPANNVPFSADSLQSMINAGRLISVKNGGAFTKVEIKNMRDAYNDAGLSTMYTILSGIKTLASMFPNKINASMSDAEITKTVQAMLPQLKEMGLLDKFGLGDASIEELNSFAAYSAPAIKNDFSALANSYQFKNLFGQVNIDDAFEDPERSREAEGFNAYLSYNPNNDVRFDLSGGYHHAYDANTAISDWPLALTYRRFDNYYANLNSNIYGANIAVSYTGGPQDFIVGFPSFSVTYNNLNASAEYTHTWKGLDITPALSYQYLHYKDVDNDDDTYLSSGFLNSSSAKMSVFGAGLRLDYKIGGLRLIGCGHVDKTDAPDKWNPSWQFAANYQINTNNFVRFVYGKSNRAPVFANTKSNFKWVREGMSDPNIIQLLGTPESDLASIHGIELGYRWKPTQQLLIDAEFYNSWSKDYGRLAAAQSMLAIDSTNLITILGNVMAGNIDYSDPVQVVSSLGQFDRKLNLRYQQLDYKVKQMGVSVNVDWIISKKLIAKVNANWQRTIIDNYFVYNQTKHIKEQFTATTKSAMNLTGLMDEFNARPEALRQSFIENAFVYTPTFDELSYFNEMTDEHKAKLIKGLKSATYFGTGYNDKETGKTYQASQVAGYYVSYSYSICKDHTTGDYFFGSANAPEQKIENNHKHKDTPSFYGVVGLIYKPTDKINISAFGNFMSARTMSISCGTVDLDAKFILNLKAGYKLSQGCELFGTANNLFANGKRDFAYTDPQKALYSIGVNFAF